MAWSAPTTSDVLSEFTPGDAAVIKNQQGGIDNIASILSRVVAEVRDAIRSGGYDLDADTTKLPLGLHNDAIAITRWKLLIALPALKAMQTEERKKAYEDALKKLGDIAAQKFAPEPPTAGTTSKGGCWGSENKVIGRMHPTPRPGVQQTGTANDYANPSEPADSGNA